MAPYFPKCAVPDGKGRPQYLDGARPATSCGTNWNHFCRQISARQVAWLQENCCADIVRGTRWNPLRRPTSQLVLGLQRAMELGVCVADTGRGTRWNPLRRPTSAVDWTAQGHGTQWNPLRHQTSVTRMLLNSGNTFLQMRAVGPIGIHLFIHHWRVLAVQREL